MKTKFLFYNIFYSKTYQDSTENEFYRFFNYPSGLRKNFITLVGVGYSADTWVYVIWYLTLMTTIYILDETSNHIKSDILTFPRCSIAHTVHHCTHKIWFISTLYIECSWWYCWHLKSGKWCVQKPLSLRSWSLK